MIVNNVRSTSQITVSSVVTPLQKAMKAFDEAQFWYQDLGSKAAAVHPGALGTQAETAAKKLDAFNTAAKSLAPADKAKLQAHMNNGKTVETYVAGCVNGIKITLMGRLDKEIAAVNAKNFSGKNRQFVEADMAATDTWYYNFSKGLGTAYGLLVKMSPPGSTNDLTLKVNTFSAAIREKYSAALVATHSASDISVGKVFYDTHIAYTVAHEFWNTAKHIADKRAMYEEAWRVGVFEHRNVKAGSRFSMEFLRNWTNDTQRKDVEGNTVRITGRSADLAKPGNILYFTGFATRDSSVLIKNPGINLYQKPFNSLNFLPESPFKINGNVDLRAVANIPGHF